MGFEEDVQRFILGPLSMNDTVPKLPLDLLGQRLAVGHGALNREGQRTALPPYEPREMQRVQWQDADGSRTMSLGFLVNRDGAHTIVGHDGLCPGYRTAVFVVPKDKLAVIGMANAIGNTGSAPYVRAMRRLVQKGLRLAPAKDPAQFAAYTGRYVDSPWSSESVIVPWGEGLAALEMPSTEWIFQRDGSGRVAGVSVNGQFTARSGPLP